MEVAERVEAAREVAETVAVVRAAAARAVAATAAVRAAAATVVAATVPHSPETM